MLLRTLLATLAIVQFAKVTLARADDDLPPVDCTAPLSTYAINTCADQALGKADARLNEVYKKVLVFIAKTGGEKPYDAKTWEEALRASQRAWLAFRDAHCKGLVPMSWSGGSATSGEVLGCMTEKTEARTKELQSMYELE
jgi:uncharacterized protein YecT (DUF1311 family)